MLAFRYSSQYELTWIVYSRNKIVFKVIVYLSQQFILEIIQVNGNTYNYKYNSNDTLSWPVKNLMPHVSHVMAYIKMCICLTTYG